MDIMDGDKTAKRRRYGAQLQAQILAECEAPGASVARVAMSHGINANIVHTWRRRARAGAARADVVPAQFVAVAVAQAPENAVAQSIQIQLQRGATMMTMSWPVAAAQQLTAWTRELLR
jgi:transposase